MLCFKKVKVKVLPYTVICRGVPVRVDTHPEPSACEVGWPVSFLTAFISPVLPRFSAGWKVSEHSVKASSRTQTVDLTHRNMCSILYATSPTKTFTTRLIRTEHSISHITVLNLGCYCIIIGSLQKLRNC